MKFTKDNLEQRKNSFYQECAKAMKPEDDPEMVRRFYEHWTAVNPNGRKMAFELIRYSSKPGQVFETSKRLATWRRNEQTNYGRLKNTKTTLPSDFNLRVYRSLSGQQFREYKKKLEANGYSFGGGVTGKWVKKNGEITWLS